jgi:hypothetical protein
VDLSCSWANLVSLWLGLSYESRMISAVYLLSAVFGIIAFFVTWASSNPGFVGGVMGALALISASYFIYRRYYMANDTQAKSTSGEAHEQTVDSTEQSMLLPTNVSDQVLEPTNVSDQVLEQPTNADNNVCFVSRSGIAFNQYPVSIPSTFPCSLPSGAFAGQVLHALVPAGYSQAGQSVPFTVPPGVWPGQVVYVPLPASDQSGEDLSPFW